MSTGLASIDGLERLAGKLAALVGKARKEDKAEVQVGFSASYALYVHENNINVKYDMELKGEPRQATYINGLRIEGKGNYWDPHGQNKFLEGPAREMENELAETVASAMMSGKTLSQGMLLAGLKLQRASMQLVPVVTGTLKASAFTRLVAGAGQTESYGAEQTSDIIT